MNSDDPHPPESDELQRLLDSGMAPAEAAVRLGLPISDAAERAAARRSGAGPPPATARPAGHPWARRLASGLVAIVVLCVIGLGVQQLVERSGSGSAPAGASDLDAGRFVVGSGGKPIVSVSQRDLFSALVLSDGAILEGPSNVGWSASGAAPGGQVSYLGQPAGRALLVTFTVGDGSQLRPTAPDQFVVNGRPAVVLVEAQDLASGQRLRVSVTRDGDVRLGDPIPDDMPLDSRTGDRLDASRARVAGTLVGASVLFTSCPAGRPGQPCVVIWTGQNPLLSPGNGTSCFVAPGIERVELGASTLLIKDRGDAEIGGACPAGSAQPVHTGDALAGPGSYFIYAVSGSNELQSVGVSRDGTVYVGVAPPADGCPCHPVANPFAAGL
jgi:hypothetical protein